MLTERFGSRLKGSAMSRTCSVDGWCAEDAFGATWSLARFLARVHLPILCRPPSSCNANRRPVEFAGLRTCKAPHGQLDGDQRNEGSQGFGNVLEILGAVLVSPGSGECAPP